MQGYPCTHLPSERMETHVSTLRKILQRSTGFILLIMGLLVIQVLCDLKVPDYTARIVDIGISRNGIDSNLPQEIRIAQFEQMLIFVPETDQDQIRALYEPSTSPSGEETLSLKSDADYTPYEDTVGRALMMLALVGDENPPAMFADYLAAFEAQLRQNLPPEMAQIPLMDLFANLPPEAMAEILTQFDTALAELPDATIPTVTAQFIAAEYEAIGKDVSAIQTAYIVRTGLMMLGIVLIAGLSMITVVLIASRVSASFCHDTRVALFRRVLLFSSHEMDELSSASLITRATNDIQQIQTSMVLLLRMVFYAPLLGIGAFLKVWGQGSAIVTVIGLAVLILMMVVILLFLFAIPKIKVVQKMIDKVNLVARELLTGMPVIRAFSTQTYEENRFDTANKDLTDVNLFVNRLMSVMMPIMMFILNGTAVVLVWVGAKRVDAGVMQIGDIMAVIQYSTQVIMAFLFLCMVSVMLPRSLVAAKRIGEIFDIPLSVVDPAVSKPFEPDKKGVVEFKNVSYRYPSAEEDVLKNISFTAKPGETVAFIGATGSGKSTLVNLIPRFFDATSGEVLVAGRNVKEVSQHDLRECLGYIPQQGVLFRGDISSNIAYGKTDATQQEIVRAAKISQSEDFILQKTDQYESDIAQGGSNVSGGQKQRLSIARAVAKDPAIYIFDDSFSALDFKTDYTLRQALKTETAHSTILIVAQRINTIINADCIHVLEDGRIVGSGTHHELLDSCEVYQQIASSQLSKEELAHE